MKTLAVAGTARHRNNFTIIRLVAAFSVLFAHAYPIMGNVPEPTGVFFAPAGVDIGSIAVAVFFITSGFLLAMSADKGSSIRAFAANRILRIYPGLIVCNGIVVLTCWAVFSHFDLSFFLAAKTLNYLAFNSLMLFNTANAFAANDRLPASFTNVRLDFADEVFGRSPPKSRFMYSWPRQCSPSALLCPPTGSAGSLQPGPVFLRSRSSVSAISPLLEASRVSTISSFTSLLEPFSTRFATGSPYPELQCSLRLLRSG